MSIKACLIINVFLLIAGLAGSVGIERKFNAAAHLLISRLKENEAYRRWRDPLLRGGEKLFMQILKVSLAICLNALLVWLVPAIGIIVSVFFVLNFIYGIVVLFGFVAILIGLAVLMPIQCLAIAWRWAGGRSRSYLSILLFGAGAVGLYICS